VDGLLTPSEWSRESILRSMPEVPVVVVPHGVRDIYRRSDVADEALRKLYDVDRFFVLHVTSTATKRKGTLELIQAWAELGTDWRERANLVILAHPLSVSVYQRYAEHLGLGDSMSLRIVAGLGLSDEDMPGVYQSAHVLCQPSRSEGFGFTPLESRACGVPVVATVCTGHSEHMDASTPGVVAIPHYASTEIDDYHGATAPAIEVSDIAMALRSARENWRALKGAALSAADSVREQWAWERVSEAPLKALVAEGAAQ
jgi:glycosyltransferase involved in cell wall biosynthesis